MIELTVFLTGAVIMALEILGTRVLNPSFGSGLYVWSALITVTLVSLSLGYFVGGMLADRMPTRRALFGLLVVAAATLGLVVVAAAPVLAAAEGLGLRGGALMGAFALFGLPLAILGMVTPFSVRLRVEEVSRVGNVAGRLYAIGTVGSVVGTLGTSFWLIPNVGHRTALIALAVVLAAWAGALFFASRAVRGGAVAAIVAAALVGLGFAAPDVEALPHVVFDEDGYLGRVIVLDEHYESGYVERLFLLDGACQTHMPPDSSGPVMCEYVRTFDLMRAWKPEPKDVYLTGLAGGAHVRLLGEHDVRFDVADIDPRALMVAREFFDMPFPKNVSLYREDGRMALRRMVADGRRYDYVITDLLTIDAVPTHLYTKEAFEEVKAALKPGGVFGVNTALVFDDDGRLASRSIHRTLAAVFPHVRCFAAHHDAASKTENRVFFASESPLTGAIPEAAAERERRFEAGDEGLLFTDDYCPFDVLLSSTSDAFRQMFRRSFPAIARAAF